MRFVRTDEFAWLVVCIGPWRMLAVLLLCCWPCSSQAVVFYGDLAPTPAMSLCDYGDLIEQVEFLPAPDRADQQPTPHEDIRQILDAINLQPDQRFADIGCGPDARWLIAAVLQRGTKQAVGYEIDPEAAENARKVVQALGLSDRIEIIEGDATQQEIDADVAVAFLWPETLERLKPQIEQVDLFVSYQHEVPGLQMTKQGSAWVWKKPEPAKALADTWVTDHSGFDTQGRPFVIYGQTRYTDGYTKNCSCGMCVFIKGEFAKLYEMQSQQLAATAAPAQKAKTEGHWETRQQKVCIKGRGCVLQNVRIWVPHSSL